MLVPVISENDPPFFAPWVTSAHQSWKKSETLQPFNKTLDQLDEVWSLTAYENDCQAFMFENECFLIYLSSAGVMICAFK